MEKGIIKSLNKEKRHGFISREKGGDVFVDFSHIQSTGFRELTEGQAVKFSVVKSIEGWQAENVQLLGHQHSVVDKKKEPLRPTVEWNRAPSPPFDFYEPVAKLRGEEEFAPDRNALLNIRKMLGISISLKSDADVVRLVEEQLPLSAVSALVEHGLQEKEIYSLIVPRRTLEHRRARKEKLSREESDRAVRVSRLMVLAEKVFGDAATGLEWLRAPKKHFGKRAPIEMMATEAGGRLVEEMLHQIDHGMAA
jgi:putative toxin-antitoxin system antitoxin component (TIGR02293 family)